MKMKPRFFAVTFLIVTVVSTGTAVTSWAGGLDKQVKQLEEYIGTLGDLAERDEWRFSAFIGEVIPQQIKPIHSYVESCIEKTTLDALDFIGLQGGYFIVQKPFTNYFGVNIPYYYYEGKNLMPREERIEEEISNYINTELVFCDFSNFEEQGFTIKKGKVKTKTTIKENEIILEVKYPLTIKKEDTKSTLDKFTVTVASRFYIIYTLSKNFIAKEVEDPGYIHLSYLADIATEHDLYVNLVPWVGNTTIFVVTDKSNVEPYNFRFANKY